jgi:hypothetical protein
MIFLKLSTIIVVLYLDFRIVKLTALKNEANPVLHAMRLENTIYVLIGVIEKIKKG